VHDTKSHLDVTDPTSGRQTGRMTAAIGEFITKAQSCQHIAVMVRRLQQCTAQ